MNLLELIKNTALDVYHSMKPVNILYGVVVNAKPLEVEVDSKFTLGAEFLLVAEHLTRHERIATIEHVETSQRELGDKKELNTSNPLTSNYKHSYIKLVFEDGLKKGDKVILYRLQGGQKYLVADRYREGEKAWYYPRKQ